MSNYLVHNNKIILLNKCFDVTWNSKLIIIIITANNQMVHFGPFLILDVLAVSQNKQTSLPLIARLIF